MYLIVTEKQIEENWDVIMHDLDLPEGYRTAREFINACKKDKMVIGGADIVVSCSPTPVNCSPIISGK